MKSALWQVEPGTASDGSFLDSVHFQTSGGLLLVSLRGKRREQIPSAAEKDMALRYFIS